MAGDRRHTNKPLLRDIKKKEKAQKAAAKKSSVKTKTAVKKNITASVASRRAKAQANEIKRQMLAHLETLTGNAKRLAITNIQRMTRGEVAKSDIIRDIAKIKPEKKSLLVVANSYSTDYQRVLRAGIKNGKSAASLAKQLLRTQPPIDDLPKWIKRIKDAAKKAIADPADYETFLSVIDGYTQYINRLTRGGATGFQHLGVRRASRAFIRNIKKASDDNVVDDIVSEWSRRKALVKQTVVARTETNNYYNAIMKEFAENNQDLVIGLYSNLSGSHPTYSFPEICEQLEGEHLFAKESDIQTPAYHPNCMCYMTYILNEEKKAA